MKKFMFSIHEKDTKTIEQEIYIFPEKDKMEEFISSLVQKMEKYNNNLFSFNEIQNEEMGETMFLVYTNTDQKYHEIIVDNKLFPRLYYRGNSFRHTIYSFLYYIKLRYNLFPDYLYNFKKVNKIKNLG
jgi:hypothetical protein